MKVRLLGTGAADGIPALFSKTRVGRYAREHGGKDRRTRSAALIDDRIKIDLPPDTLAQVLRDGLDPNEWDALLFTHSHDDHFAPAELQYAMFPFCDCDYLPFPVYGNRQVCTLLRERFPSWPIEVVETRSFETFAVGDYRITPIEAMHIPEEDAHNLIIEKDGRCLLYATDTGLWPDHTWEFLSGVCIDALVIECTNGRTFCDYLGHLNIEECVRVVERLREMGTLGPKAQVVTTHHSERGDVTHAELESVLAPYAIEPGFDGMDMIV
jgi:phosphoribosyl 1,2-cyclic phosphate phosphodiesterase